MILPSQYNPGLGGEEAWIGEHLLKTTEAIEQLLLLSHDSPQTDLTTENGA